MYNNQDKFGWLKDPRENMTLNAKTYSFKVIAKFVKDLTATSEFMTCVSPIRAIRSLEEDHEALLDSFERGIKSLPEKVYTVVRTQPPPNMHPESAGYPQWHKIEKNFQKWVAEQGPAELMRLTNSKRTRRNFKISRRRRPGPIPKRTPCPTPRPRIQTRACSRCSNRS